MQRQYSIKLYTIYKNQFPKMTFIQHDTEDNKITFELFDDIDVPMENIVEATATVKREDNKTFTYGMDCFEIVDNLVTFILPPSAVYVAGKCSCSISLYDNNLGRLTTQTFSYEVTAELISDTPIDESNDYPVLTKLINDVNTATEGFKASGTDGLSTEIILARDGEATLRDKINKIDDNINTQNIHLTSIDTSLNEIMQQDYNLKNEGNISFDFDITQINSMNAITPLSIPSYVAGNNQVVHPSILFFPEKWNNYHYWIAYTPYANTDSQYENPCIACSNDGISWAVPNGLTNPIVPKPAGGYNSDTHLVKDKDGKTVHCIYRERLSTTPSTNNIKVISSTDGITWSNITTIITSQGSDNASPCIIYDNNKYTLFSVNLDQSTPVTALQMYTANDIKGTWSYIKDIQLPNIPNGQMIWHFEVKKYGGLYLVLYSMCSVGSSGADGYLYMAKSKDLINWTTSSQILQSQSWDAKFYKSSFMLVQKPDGYYFALWYGSTSWKIGFTTINLIQKAQDELERKIIKAINHIYGYPFADTFSRADNTTSLGNASSGQTWTYLNSNMGIISGEAYASVDASNSKAVIDTGISDFEYSSQISVPVNNTWLIFRATDTNNYFRLGFASATVVYVQKVSGGAVTTISDVLNVIHSLDIVKIICKGSNIKVYINDVLQCDLTDTFNQTATKVGMQTNSTNARYRNLVVKRI